MIEPGALMARKTQSSLRRTHQKLESGMQLL